ncbi:unnamed protein product [Plutella xylostella]|uniref:Large ribosomal subunit protein bL32m n=1 Tax=Plutella xylostella TaxID=51655 RepID=A0A8S4FXV1_PLUXY|nr:unnamed protein product [Plutella xylostella]
MIPRVNILFNILRNIERSVFQIFGQPPRELALAYVHENPTPAPGKKFSLADLIGDGILYAMPKSRRTVEKRMKRKFGHPDYHYKLLLPKTNILVCTDCGHNYERGHLCANCYNKVEKETKEIQAQIREKLGTGPVEKDVVVLYEGETTPDQPKEFWNGKRIIEMKKERPKWFSKNLLQKTTQQPSNSTDVKPKDLA